MLIRSVAIAAGYSAIYPRDSPGGWNLLGHTDVELWNDSADPPVLLAPGTVVHFTDAEVDGLRTPTTPTTPRSADDSRHDRGHRARCRQSRIWPSGLPTSRCSAVGCRRPFGDDTRHQDTRRQHRGRTDDRVDTRRSFSVATQTL